MSNSQVSHSPTVKTWNILANTYAEKFSGLTLYDESYHSFFGRLSFNASVLEVGAGPGIIAGFVNRAYPHLQMVITDAAEEMIRISEQRFPHYRHLCLKAEELSTMEGFFDGIVSGFCVPYLSAAQTQNFIHDVYKKLNEEGLFYLSFMEDDYSASGLQKGSTGHEMMVYYYTKNQIANWLFEAGFEITEQFNIPPGELTTKCQCMLVARKILKH